MNHEPPVIATERLEPSARIFEVFRNAGYELPAAIADLVDNSLDAGAKNILIRFVRNTSSLERLQVIDDGRGMTEAEAREAMRLVGRTEGLLLDPVYTAKAMAGLIDHIRRGLIEKEANVVFLHTGGLPALFAYAETLGLEDLLHAEG